MLTPVQKKKVKEIYKKMKGNLYVCNHKSGRDENENPIYRTKCSTEQIFGFDVFVSLPFRRTQFCFHPLSVLAYSPKKHSLVYKKIERIFLKHFHLIFTFWCQKTWIPLIHRLTSVYIHIFRGCVRHTCWILSNLKMISDEAVKKRSGIRWMLIKQYVRTAREQFRRW